VGIEGPLVQKRDALTDKDDDEGGAADAVAQA